MVFFDRRLPALQQYREIRTLSIGPEYSIVEQVAEGPASSEMASWSGITVPVNSVISPTAAESGSRSVHHCSHRVSLRCTCAHVLTVQKIDQ